MRLVAFVATTNPCAISLDEKDILYRIMAVRFQILHTHYRGFLIKKNFVFLLLCCFMIFAFFSAKYLELRNCMMDAFKKCLKGSLVASFLGNQQYVLHKNFLKLIGKSFVYFYP